MNQLAQAAQQAAGGSSGDAPAATLQRLDTFLAANWQAYSEFAENMLQVRPAQSSLPARSTSPALGCVLKKVRDTCMAALAALRVDGCVHDGNG